MQITLSIIILLHVGAAAVKCTKFSLCRKQSYHCAFRRATDFEGVCVSAQEYYGVSQPLPYELFTTQWKMESIAKQETLPSAVRTDAHLKTSTSPAIPELAEISDAPFQPHSVDHKLAPKAPDAPVNPDPQNTANFNIADPEPVLSDTSTLFSSDSVNPKSITALEPPYENSMSKVTTESQVVTGET